ESSHLGRDVRLEGADAEDQHQQGDEKQRLEGHDEMADRHEDAAEHDCAPLAEQAVGNESTKDRRAIGKAGIEPEKLRSERLRLELSEQELEPCLDRSKA